MSDIAPRRLRSAGSTRRAAVPRSVRSEPVRLARVHAARARILAGFYERRDVKSTLAREVLTALREE